MAAVEVIRRGYERYIIAGSQAQNNVGVINRAPTGYQTVGSATVYGNTAYGSSTTTAIGGGPVVYGTRDQGLSIVMFNRGDAGFERGLDARQALGPDWPTIVRNGVKTCG